MNLHAESEKSSIAEIISKQWPRCQEVKSVIQNILKNEEKLLFIIDGFDELRYSFDQSEDSFCFDPWKEEPVKIILRSLFQKKLLPKSSLIITTRPTALEKLRLCLKRPHFFQILGFSRKEREEYFYKFFGEDKDQATQALRFVKQNDTLFTMCVIPLVSWIICTVMKQEMERGMDLQKTPCTLTAIYMLYLSSLLDFHHKEFKQDVQRKLKSFCSLAAEGIWKQQILFMEEEVKKHSLYQDDLFPLFLNQNIFKRDIHCIQTFSFIHLSFQEFFAALFYVLEDGEEQRSQNPNKNLLTVLHKHSIYSQTDFAVGFHFLFGLLNEENRMKELKKKFGWEISSQNKELLLDWVKEKIDRRIYRIESGSITGTDLDWVMQHYPETYVVKFFHKRIYFYMETEILSYLYETQDENFVKDALCAVTTMEYHCNSDTELMILAYCLQHCQNLEKLCVRSPTSIYPTEKKMFLLEHGQCGLDEVCMEDFFQTLTKLRTLRVLRLEKWSFTQSCSKQLVEVCKTNQKLKELNLFLKDTNERAMELLCEGLQHPDCEIEILEVAGEAMTEFCSRHLAEVFRRKQSLRDLKLSVFSPKYRVVERLCEGLQDPDCRVEKLWLNEEFVTEPGSRHVAEVLRRNQRLRELWLCLIYPEHEAFRMLCEGLQHPDCKVEKLWLVGSTMTEFCSMHLAEVFRKTQRLRELCLWLCKPDGRVVEMLCEGLQHPDCKVEKLGIHEDFVESCSRHFLEVLKKNQRLRELQLFLYILDEEVEEMLCEGLQHPDCKIEKLRLEGQFLKESFCRRFAEILRKNQRLRELDLFPDYLDDRVIEMLCKALKHPDCKIEKLGLGAKFLTQPFNRQLTRVLRLRNLELFPTYRDDRAAEMLPAGLKYSKCKLKALRINGEYMKKYLGSQIAGIVKINQKLRELHLHGDCISDYEMKLLWEELKHSGHKLKELWLNGEHIVQKGEWMDTEHAARASSVNAASSCLLV